MTRASSRRLYRLPLSERSGPQNYWYKRAVLTLAANADPKLATTLLDDLASGAIPSTERQDVLFALSDVPSVLAYYKSNPGNLLKLGQFERIRIFEHVCDATTRTELE
jgi:hypothetical protein